MAKQIKADEEINREKYYIIKGDINDEQKPIHRKRIKFKVKK